ncbi:selenoprotein H [Telopea speciosissima]|uniref:selenoprotein H n=1 Tax=Telopea speciosissima TaxID=54955 RepID=UPI001CC781FD|nr:selenoprotein H [Telopea speciosissima]
MAKKRKSQETEPSSSAATSQPAAPENRRLTRSSAKASTIVVEASVPAKKPKKRGKKVKKESVKDTEENQDSDVSDAPLGQISGSKTIIIEHCKQCQSFKKRAELVKDGLEKGVPGIIVMVNPEKPRKGCFEIREEDGEKFVSLLDMKRPFKNMKDLDMEKVISDIILKIK